MRRSVADFLEDRICPDAIMVVCAPVPANGLEMLRAGYVWSVTYDAGRLLGEVGIWDLIAGGHHDVLRAWVDADGGVDGAVRRAICGETIMASERATLRAYDRALVLLVDHGAGRPIDPAEVATLEAVGQSEDLYWLRGLQQRLQGSAAAPHRLPLTDEPIVPVVADGEPDPYTYVSTGDLDGCRRQLDAAIARADALEAVDTPSKSWPKIARQCRLLTGDDAVAMSHLERARFADVRDDWVEIFGALGAARVQREKDLVLAAIEQAFDGVPFPGPKHKSLYQAEAADSYRGCDQAKDHKGRWQDLPREHILECQFALAHLGGHSLQYYLPALMSFVVREHDQKREDHGSRWIFETVEYHLQFRFDNPQLAAHAKKRHRLFTPAQFGAVARFAEYYRSEPADRARWNALAHGGEWPTA